TADLVGRRVSSRLARCHGSATAYRPGLPGWSRCCRLPGRPSHHTVPLGWSGDLARVARAHLPKAFPVIHLELSVNERLEELRREARLEELRAQLPRRPSFAHQVEGRILRGALQSAVVARARRLWHS